MFWTFSRFIQPRLKTFLKMKSLFFWRKTLPCKKNLNTVHNHSLLFALDVILHVRRSSSDTNVHLDSCRVAKKSTCRTAVEGKRITPSVLKRCSWHMLRPAAAFQQCAVFVATRQMCLPQPQMLFSRPHPSQAGEAAIEVAVPRRRHRHSESETERVSLRPNHTPSPLFLLLWD